MNVEQPSTRQPASLLTTTCSTNNMADRVHVYHQRLLVHLLYFCIQEDGFIWDRFGWDISRFVPSGWTTFCFLYPSAN